MTRRWSAELSRSPAQPAAGPLTLEVVGSVVVPGNGYLPSPTARRGAATPPATEVYQAAVAELQQAQKGKGPGGLRAASPARKPTSGSFAPGSLAPLAIPPSPSGHSGSSQSLLSLAGANGGSKPPTPNRSPTKRHTADLAPRVTFGPAYYGSQQQTYQPPSSPTAVGLQRRATSAPSPNSTSHQRPLSAETLALLQPALRTGGGLAQQQHHHHHAAALHSQPGTEHGSGGSSRLLKLTTTALAPCGTVLNATGQVVLFSPRDHGPLSPGNGATLSHLPSSGMPSPKSHMISAESNLVTCDSSESSSPTKPAARRRGSIERYPVVVAAAVERAASSSSTELLSPHGGGGGYVGGFVLTPGSHQQQDAAGQRLAGRSKGGSSGGALARRPAQEQAVRAADSTMSTPHSAGAAITSGGGGGGGSAGSSGGASRVMSRSNSANTHGMQPTRLAIHGSATGGAATPSSSRLSSAQQTPTSAFASSAAAAAAAAAAPWAATSCEPTPPGSRPGSGKNQAVMALVDAVRSKDSRQLAMAIEQLRQPDGAVMGVNDRHPVTGRTALHEAVMVNSVAMVRTLLQGGSDVDAGHATQGPALLHAAAWGEDAMAELLLAAGASVHASDVASYTALHYACAGNHISTAQLLAQHGANVCALNFERQTPLELARPDVRAVLEATIGCSSAAARPAPLTIPGSHPLLHNAHSLAHGNSSGASPYEGPSRADSGQATPSGAAAAAVAAGAAAAPAASVAAAATAKQHSPQHQVQQPLLAHALSSGASPDTSALPSPLASPPPQLSLPAGIRQQLFRPASLDDVISAFEADDLQLVRSSSSGGSGGGGAVPLAGPQPPDLDRMPSNVSMAHMQREPTADDLVGPAPLSPPALAAAAAAAVTPSTPSTPIVFGVPPGSLPPTPAGLQAAVIVIPKTPKIMFGTGVTVNTAGAPPAPAPAPSHGAPALPPTATSVAAAASTMLPGPQVSGSGDGLERSLSAASVSSNGGLPQLLDGGDTSPVGSAAATPRVRRSTAAQKAVEAAMAALPAVMAVAAASQEREGDQQQQHDDADCNCQEQRQQVVHADGGSTSAIARGAAAAAAAVCASQARQSLSMQAAQLRTAKLFAKATDMQAGAVRWQQGDLLGEGAYGRVYAGLDLRTGGMMAVKVVELAGRGSASNVAQVLAELDVAKRLSHHHVVGYLDAHFDAQALRLYIFLEYVSGGSIADMLHRLGGFQEALAAKYTAQLLEGLGYLHGCRIVHRDVKGANVLVTRDGVVKLADFGASKAFKDTTISEGMKSLRGSVYWMAPEVIKGARYGRKADVWSLGCSLIEMLTADHPWPQLDNPWTAMFHIAKCEEGPPRPAGVSAACVDFLDRCLAYDPDSRPSVSELLQHPFVRDAPLA